MSLRRSGIELARVRTDEEAKPDTRSSRPKTVAFARLPSKSKLSPPPPQTMSAFAGSLYEDDRLLSGERVSPRRRKRVFVRHVALVALVLVFAIGFVCAFVHRLPGGC